ncbi:Poly-beta-1,6-N-acetyl-D-glucosamine synthase [Phycisphaerales bacterium]|nr:Poly-beta-1,6-N-acetyl-D-glucosamine synthase [Phycisphaerales bacterium]
MNVPPITSEPGLSVVIPCHNEHGAIASTIHEVREILAREPRAWEIIVVNDGSTDGSDKILDDLASADPALRVVHNQGNRGYGFSLKRGISVAKYDRLLITDADGTYPHARIPDLVAGLDAADMVVGARTGQNVNIPLARRPAKWALLNYARWMARADIKDVNSGMRVMWAKNVHRFWSMLPDGFSFTTTITMAHHINRLSVTYLPIDYFKRIGSSGIHPIKDTINFFMLVLRTTMYFRPLQVFGGLAVFLMILSIVQAVATRVVLGEIHDITTISLFLLGIQFFGLGLLGDLINSHRQR